MTPSGGELSSVLTSGLPYVRPFIESYRPVFVRNISLVLSTYCMVVFIFIIDLLYLLAVIYHIQYLWWKSKMKEICRTLTKRRTTTRRSQDSRIDDEVIVDVPKSQLYLLWYELPRPKNQWLSIHQLSTQQKKLCCMGKHFTNTPTCWWYIVYQQRRVIPPFNINLGNWYNIYITCLYGEQ